MDNNSHGMNRDSALALPQWGKSVEVHAVATSPSFEPPLIPPESPRLAAMFDDRSVGAEKFRVLASRLQYLRKQHTLKRIVITSAIKGEGKSVIAANLAVTLGRRHKTLLVDGDLRQSGLAQLLDSNHLPGLSDWWRQSAPVTTFVRRVGSFRLSCLPAGKPASQPLEMLQSPRMSEMLNEIAESFEWVIIDAPPLILTDPNLWATLSDGTLLVVKQGTTPKRLLRECLESVENLKLIGVVMNGSQDADHRYYGHYYKSFRRQVTAGAESAG